MGPLQYATLIAAVLAGAFLGTCLPQLRERWLHFLLSFSGAYLLSITAIHLLPEAFAGGDAAVGLSLLAGFFLQVVLEQFSSGVEHGHIHTHGGRSVALPLLVGLSVHALIEGTPLTLVEDALHAGHGHDHNHLLTAIALHKLPAGFALAVVLTGVGFRQNLVWALVTVFALMSPLGAVLGERLVAPAYVPYALGAVVGSLLHVSTTILFESDDARAHRLSLGKLSVIAAGIVVALLTAYV